MALWNTALLYCWIGVGSAIDSLGREFIEKLAEQFPDDVNLLLSRAAGLVSWTDDRIVPDLSVHVEDIAFETPQARVRDLSADLHVTGLAPLATSGRQTLTATVQPGGLPAAPLSLQFELKAKPAVHVETLTYDFAGGRITASPFTIDPAHPNFTTNFTINFTIEPLDSFSSSSGTLPGNEVVTPAPLTVTGITADKVYDGTTTAEALMQERPPLSEIAPAITSMYSRQFSIQSSPMRNLLQPGPWSWMAGLLAYWAMVFLSPKISERPELLRISAAPSWSVG
mgnify:CR=1 FL=1